MGSSGDETFRSADSVAPDEPTEADVILDDLNRALRTPEGIPETTEGVKSYAFVHTLKRRVQAIRFERNRLYRQLREAQCGESSLREGAATLEALLEQTRGHLRRSRDENAQLEVERHRLETNVVQLEAERHRLETNVARLEAERHRLEANVAQQQSETARLASQAAELRQVIRAVQSSRSWRLANTCRNLLRGSARLFADLTHWPCFGTLIPVGRRGCERMRKPAVRTD